ncbi:hypothetical protein JST56_02930 [Candidatus Dependentiae bacterium]|jgi:N-acetylmuramic acid 6-phosphate etherase|nr:hypothetical protein [Candidatus Dependentiae bacterium]
MMKNNFFVVMLFMLVNSTVMVRPLDYADLVTEQAHPKTKNLSSVLMSNTEDGLRLLNDIDYSVISSLRTFQAEQYQNIVTQIIKTIQNNGRIFFLGSGSSGRIALNLTAQWNELCKRSRNPKFGEYQNRVIGIIAGGLRAFIRAKEGFEDSEQEGALALTSRNLNANDTVFLLSASGSAAFNHGAALAALQCGALCYHILNVPETLPKAEALFAQGIIPVKIATQPQAIKGSTRLQAATATNVALSMTLLAVVDQLAGKEDTAQKIADQLIIDFEKACLEIRTIIPEIAKIIEGVVLVLSSPHANFRKIKDETNCGYITYLGMNFLREIITDSVELSPTFSINPTRGSNEVGKRPEFRAFILGAESNADAWQRVSNRVLTDEELKDVADVILGGVNQGAQESFLARPVGVGNIVIVVVNDADDKKIIENAVLELQQRGGQTALIQVSSGLKPASLEKMVNTSIFLGGILSPCVQSMATKQILNLISNAAMIKMGKVCGNLMIDVCASNKKLFDRTVRIIREVYALQAPAKVVPSYDEVNIMVEKVQAQRKYIETTQSIYLPSTVKIASVMLLKNISFQEAVDCLIGCEERLDCILS